MSEINREPVNEYSRTIRYAKHAHTRTLRDTRVVERSSDNAKHRAQGEEGARLNVLQTKRARQTADDRRAERRKKKKKESAEEDGAQRGVWVEGLKESSHVSASRR